MKKFEEIYEAYFNDVFLYIRRLSGSAQIAEEITSDTFFKALSTIDRFRGDCDIRVWLCQIAKNSYYSYLKKHRRIKNLEEKDIRRLQTSGNSPQDELEQQEKIQEIRDILHTLKEPYKDVFMWRVFAELSFKDIGQIYRKTENWACVTYHRARTMIKNKMEDDDRE